MSPVRFGEMIVNISSLPPRSTVASNIFNYGGSRGNSAICPNLVPRLYRCFIYMVDMRAQGRGRSIKSEVWNESLAARVHLLFLLNITMKTPFCESTKAMDIFSTNKSKKKGVSTITKEHLLLENFMTEHHKRTLCIRKQLNHKTNSSSLYKNTIASLFPSLKQKSNNKHPSSLNDKTKS